MERSFYQATDFEKVRQQLVHDIASPLTVMQLNIGFVKNMLPENNFLMMESALNQIREITYSALNKKSISLKADLIPLAKKIIFEKTYIWENNPCEIVLEVKNNIRSACVFACATQVYRMLSNLLNNAYDSLLENRKIILNITEETNHILFLITDTGCGIPKNKISSVLQGESLKQGGHGIGLSSAFKYMQSINGCLILQSEENQGTEVRLIFPKAY